MESFSSQSLSDSTPGGNDDAQESPSLALDQPVQPDDGLNLAAAQVPIVDVSTMLYGHDTHEAKHNETLRRSWRRSSTLMNLLSEHNVQRIRMMFDAKSDSDGLSLSEFLFVLHKCLVR